MTVSWEVPRSETQLLAQRREAVAAGTQYLVANYGEKLPVLGIRGRRHDVLMVPRTAVGLLTEECKEPSAK